MPLFTLTSNNVAHGVYAQELPTPAIITPSGSNVAVLLGQFPWGPIQQLTYPGTLATTGSMFAPQGGVRTGSAWLSVIRKTWPILGIVRIGDPTSVAATASILQSSTTLLTLTAKYQGTLGNSIIATVGPPDDGNSNHFNLTLVLSGTSGTTSETYRNWNVSGTGSNVVASASDIANSALLGGVTVVASGIPTAGNYSFSGGTAGTVTAASYVGTPGGNDKGFALLEGDTTIDGVCIDDPGSTLRPTVNAGLMAHAALCTDRVAYINGISGQTPANAQADVLNYSSNNVCYVDPWVWVSDDTDGTIRLIPSASFAMAVAAQIPCSLSGAWKSDTISGLLTGISTLEADRGNYTVRSQNDAAGITTLIKRPQRGGFCFEAWQNTSNTPGKTELTRTRTGIYIAKSTVNAWQTSVDAPNTPWFQQDLINSLTIFLEGMKQAYKSQNAAITPYIVNYGIASAAAANTNASLANNNYTVAAQVQTGSNMSRINLALQYGPTVTVTAA